MCLNRSFLFSCFSSLFYFLVLLLKRISFFFFPQNPYSNLTLATSAICHLYNSFVCWRKCFVILYSVFLYLYLFLSILCHVMLDGLNLSSCHGTSIITWTDFVHKLCIHTITVGWFLSRRRYTAFVLQLLCSMFIFDHLRPIVWRIGWNVCS